MIPDAPGIYTAAEVSMDEYLAIRALSASPLRTLDEQCPRAGWFCSKFNPTPPPPSHGDDMDTGTIAHGLFLEGGTDRLVIVDPKDYPAERTGNIPDGWTNKAIRTRRDELRAAGKCPIFPAKHADIVAMVTSAQAFVASLREAEPAIHAMFQPGGGSSEVTIVWEEGPTLCKLRIDRVSDDWRIICDYKTGKVSAHPDTWARSKMTEHGFDAAFYRRGVRAYTGVDPVPIFLAQENEAPYLCSMPGLDPAWRSMMAARVALALTAWNECAAKNEWPGYPARVVYPEVPPWEMAAFEAKNEAHGIPYDYATLTGRKGP